MVTWEYPPPGSIAGDAPARTVGTHSLTKHLAEVICEHFARNHRLSIVCLRMAKPIDPEEPHWKHTLLRPQWIAFPDLVPACRLALTVPDIGFEIVTIVGDGSRCRWDLGQAKRVLGYRPTFRLEDLGFRLGEERDPFSTSTW